MRSRVPALDGLRGAAVVAVLLSHGGVGWLPGGFLGVGAFCVLSGYLVTTSLLAGDPRTFRSGRVRRLASALLAAAVAAAVAYLAGWRAVAAYVLWPLLAGAALAVVLYGRVSPARPRVLTWSGVAGAAVTGWLWHAANGSTPYRGGFLLAAVATAAVVAAVVTVQTSPLARALAVRPLRAVGRVSYGIYLWHWPVFLLLTHERTHLAVLPLLALRLVVTAAFTTVSWFLVGVPARPQAPRPLRPVAVAAAAVLVVAGFTAYRHGGSPATTRAAATDAGQPTVPPELASVPVTRIVVKPKAPGTARVLLLGDSVAETLGAGLRDSDGIGVVTAATRGCGIATGGRYRYSGGEYADLPQCADWPRTWSRVVGETDPDLVAVLVGRWDVLDRWHDGRWERVGDAAFDEYLRQQLEQVLRVANGRRLALLTAPYYAEGDSARVDRFNALLRSVAEPHHVPVVDLGAALAPEGVFTERINGTLVRYGGGQVSPAGAQLVQPWLYRQLTAALGRGTA